MARCMAALSKLANCNPGSEAAASALQESCSMPCDWAGLELEPGSRILGKGGQDFGYVAKFKRGPEANDESMPEAGCVVVLRGADGEDLGFPLASTAHSGSPGASSSPEDSLEGWESDAACDGCKVSAALKSAWMSLRERVMDGLLDAGCKPADFTTESRDGDHVFVTGHSKGAALATLAMFSLQAEETYNVEASYNFASPRVGNEEFVAKFNSLFRAEYPLFRVTHANDRVPLEPLGQNLYVHAGTQVWYPSDTNDNDFVVCGNTTSPEDLNCGIAASKLPELCPTKQVQCVNNTCTQTCKEWAPVGPHCRNPLAPAKNFCDFSSKSTDNWGSEWNEVVKTEGSMLAWEKTCVWGQPPTATLPKKRQDDKQVVQKVEAEQDTKQDDVDGQETGKQGAVAATPSGSAPRGESPGRIKEESQTCFKTDVTYAPHMDMKGHYFTTESDAWACQARCAGIEGCTHFSFFRRDEDGDCHVTDSGTEQTSSTGFVSGPAVCKIDVEDSSFVELLSSEDSGFSADFVAPGVSAIGVVAGYFVVLAGFAYGSRLMRPQHARTAFPPPEEMEAFLSKSNRARAEDSDDSLPSSA